MSKTTRKHIWPVSLVMSIAIVGALAAFLVLTTNPGNAQAHGEWVDGQEHCPQISDEIAHDEGTFDHTCDTGPTGTGNGDGNGGMMGDAMHATMPMYFWLEALDNGARLSWEMPNPNTVAANASIVRYQIHRDAWHSTPSHPINDYGDAYIDVDAYMTDHRDLGLAYETVYTYRTRAVVEYNVEGWWDMLDCPAMNAAVSPRSGEPAVGSDDPMASPRSPYCAMYDDLSAAAMVVVQRAYAGLDPMEYTYYGEWSNKRTLETADSGGRLAALLDPPSMVLMLRADPACDNMITVRWSVPDYFGTVPELDENGVYVGPDYIGGERAGKEEVGEDATSVTYQVQRMVNNGAWVAVTPVGRSYTDNTVAYGNTYKYRVRAMNGASLTGPWVMVMETLVAPDRPLRPSSLVATHGVSSDNSNQPAIILQWDAPVDSTTNPLWREQSDVDTDMENQSTSLQYQIQRSIGTGGNWVTLDTQRHKYAQNMTAMEAINNFRTQRYEDTADAALDADNVSYRVAALVDGCNLSPWNLVDDVEGEPQARSLGTPASVAATSGAAGAITVSYTAGVNATGHLIILAQGSTLVDFDVSTDGSDASFSNVAAGNYTAIVVSFRRMGGTLEFKHSRSTVTVN